MSPTWRVDWDSISTRGDLLWLMFTQLAPHVQAAIRGGRAILAGDYNVESASTFLFSAAVVGDFFWPSGMRSRNRHGISEAFPDRARDMRHLVGLPDEEPSNLDLIRNDLTHVDERLEELFVQEPGGPMIAWGDGSRSRAGTRRYMNFDRSSGVIHSLGREVDVAEVTEWLEDLLTRISRVSGQLMVRSHNLGGFQHQTAQTDG